MKRLLILPLLFVGVGAWALPKQCEHPPIPKNITGTDIFKYEEKIRPQLIKSGWRPNINSENKDSVFYNEKMPEAICGAPSCQYSYIDKKGNHLYVYIGDFVHHVQLDCKN